MSNKPSSVEEIGAIDYTILFAKDFKAMVAFYSEVMKFKADASDDADWVEFIVGSNRLTVTSRQPMGAAMNSVAEFRPIPMQLAFRVSAAAVDKCADELTAQGISMVEAPTNQVWGHRTLFFRDPDNNLLEIYAEI